MVPQQDKQIIINENFIKGYERLKLVQKINEHHLFELEIDLETVEDEGAYTIDKSKEWLGKTIIINTHGKDFTGVITNIYINHENGHHGQIILEGYSSTILLENGDHMQSWLDKGLKSIVENITTHPRVTASIAPKYTTIINYESQYAESNFQFLKRLSKQYHEWLYYDGDVLFFGKPEGKEPTIMTYGKDVTEIKIGIQTQARKYSSFSYNSSNNEQYTSNSPDDPSGLNELGQLAFNASLDNYQEPTNVYSELRAGNKADLDEHLKKKQQSDYANSNFIKIKSVRRGLTLGDVIDLRSEINKGKGELEEKRHGEYIITEIEHLAGAGNHYTNTITALASGIEVLPAPKVNFPLAQTQMATVVDNEDPKGKGRVQVKMHWQTGEMKTSWLRVLTPDGGSSELNATNRGFVFIPEVKDQVLVSFRYNDPNRPFVMGSLFNGTTASGGGDKNVKKSIITRGGNVIELDDTKSKEKITIKDKDGSIITFDTNAKSLFVQSVETMEFSAKNVKINAEENIELSAKKEIIIASEKDTSILSKSSVNMQSEQGTNIVSDDKISIEATSDLELKGQNATVEGQVATTLKGQQTKVEGQMTTVQGASGKVDVM